MPNLPDLFDLSGRVAVVTGGAGLLGAEFCRTLAEAGARLVIADLEPAKARSLAQELKQAGLQAISVPTDVADEQSVQHMVQATLDAYGRLDILVNSAALDPKFDPGHQGVSEVGEQISTSRPPYDLTFENYPLELWNQALAVNLTGMFLCCQAAARLMLAQGSGVIVNLSSIYGLAAPDQRLYQREGQPPQYKPIYYSVTKAGVIGLTRYLAAYYAGKNIRVNTLSPGGVYNNHDEDFVQAYSAHAILGRMADKDDMNGALLFLASDASAYMTGANLVVDGGWTTW
jgi:NAD(P)-dependent dehydrogenase (short-subunit alcohol dehydrogenase family)